jgi:hypothetical protein
VALPTSSTPLQLGALAVVVAQQAEQALAAAIQAMVAALEAMGTTIPPLFGTAVVAQEATQVMAEPEALLTWEQTQQQVLVVGAVEEVIFKEAVWVSTAKEPAALPEMRLLTLAVVALEEKTEATTMPMVATLAVVVRATLALAAKALSG